MMPLQWLPVIAAGLVPFLVGVVWYHPRVFGATWMSLKHITPEMAERSARLESHSTAIMLALGLIAALVVRVIIAALAIDTLFDALCTGFGLWLAFIVPSTINRVLWDHVPLRLYCIESGQWLVSCMLMTVVLF